MEEKIEIEETEKDTVSEVFERALENSVNLYKIATKDESNEDWKITLAKINNGEPPVLFEKSSLHSQMALWSIVGYGNCGIPYLEGLANDKDLCVKIMVGLMNIIDPDINENLDEDKEIKI